jgi:hypothetical protein
VPVSTQFGSGPTHLLLYFWDSTQSTLYSVDATAPTIFTPLLALDQNTPAGQHFKTQYNHIAYDFNTATVLVADGSSNSIMEVNPASLPVTTTTLFANLPGTPTSIAIQPDRLQVYVQIGASIYVGPRSGGALSLFATGFPLLSDIKVGNATFGTGGFSLFAVDKTNNTVYQMPLASPPPPAGLTAVGAPSTGLSFNVNLSWTASPATNVAGYNVYRASTSGGPFTKVNTALVTGLAFTDTSTPALVRRSPATM